MLSAGSSGTDPSDEAFLFRLYVHGTAQVKAPRSTVRAVLVLDVVSEVRWFGIVTRGSERLGPRFPLRLTVPFWVP